MHKLVASVLSLSCKRFPHTLVCPPPPPLSAADGVGIALLSVEGSPLGVFVVLPPIAFRYLCTVAMAARLVPRYACVLTLSTTTTTTDVAGEW